MEIIRTILGEGQTMQNVLIEMALGFVLMPWGIFVTVSIFNQRQELALMKQSHNDIKNLIQTLVRILNKSHF